MHIHVHVYSKFKTKDVHVCIVDKLTNTPWTLYWPSPAVVLSSAMVHSDPPLPCTLCI